jgi:hypothetical protein
LKNPLSYYNAGAVISKVVGLAPAIVIYNASDVNVYYATISLVNFEKKNVPLKKTL